MNKLSRNGGVSPETNSGNARQLVGRRLKAPIHQLRSGIYILAVSIAVFVLAGCGTITQEEKDRFRMEPNPFPPHSPFGLYAESE